MGCGGGQKGGNRLKEGGKIGTWTREAGRDVGKCTAMNKKRIKEKLTGNFDKLHPDRVSPHTSS